MEKIEFRGMWVRGDFYNAADVDAMLADVRRLVEAARRVIKISDRKHDAWDDAKQAIAAVERHLLKN